MKLKFDYCSRWLLVVVAALLCNFAIAQNRTLTGKVTDKSSGESLIGANIIVSGTSTGTVTDFDGAYSLQVSGDAKELEFSYTGYTSQRIAIGASNVIDIQLAVGQSLDEVVVTGYGSQKTREVSSAIVNVNAEKFNGGNITSAAQLLQGKVAGLTIARPGGNPNEGFNIRLRGLSSLGANAQPLIVIDGIIGGTLDNVDPNDIASMTVLKDASSAAIYGSRASSGVILITTKSGAQGKSSVDYNGYITADNAFRNTQVMNATEWRALGASLPANDKRGWSDNGSNTDWQKEVTRSALSQVHNLSISAGNKQTSFRVSANYRGLQGVVNGNDQNRLNARVNLTHKALNDRLRFSTSLTITSRHDVGANGNGLFTAPLRQANLFNPTAPIFSNAPENVKFGGYFEQDNFDYFNPVSTQKQNNINQDLSQFQGSLQLEYDIIKNLTASAFYSEKRDNTFGGAYANRTAKSGGFGAQGSANRRQDQERNRQATFKLSYRKDIGKLNLNATVGYDYNYLNFQGFGATGGKFLTDGFGYNNLGASLDFPLGLGSAYSYQNDYTVVSQFGRLSLSYNNTFFFNANVRRDGNSRFGENNKYGTFPGLSAAVDLVKLTGIKFADQLKLRASYGVVGNAPGSSYNSLQLFGPGQQFFYNGSFVPSYGPFRNANPNLQWERKQDLTIGLDFSALDYRLTGSIDFYNTQTKNLLFDINVPVPPNLVGSTLTNLGELKNQGLELALNYNIIKTKKFEYTASLTGTYYLDYRIISLSTPEAKLGELFLAGVGSPGLNNFNMIRVKEGEKIGNFWGAVYKGYTPEGKWIVQDLNGDGKADDPGSEGDKKVIGNGLPKAEIGFGNTFKFGNFDLNVFFRGVFGHDLINQYRTFYETNNTLTWNRVNTKFYDPKNFTAASFHSHYVESGSYLKLDNATLGYTVKLKPGSAFNRVRAYIAGQNLFVITKYTGSDPEVRFTDIEQGGANAALSPGIDRRNTYFMVRGVTFGVNLGF